MSETPTPPAESSPAEDRLPTIREDGLAAYLKSWKVPFLGILAFAVPIAAIWGFVEYRSSGAVEREAVEQCESAVKDKMKSPSTAEFPGTSAHEGSDFVLGDIPARYQSMDAVSAWVVTGPVDAQNGFGATVRSEFNCRAIFSDGNFAATEIKFLD
ncbi:hypothetical protein A6411_10585 [Prescottella equi]|uniref:hypothetical protein n=1 Tax=Rhodococcus hoagii TaxID=43767 RepID=UPI0009C0F52F|nr:hypothetical protein [Prescottella equi]OQQ32245.1 hypothetical protein A6411_10585 [Prescottella equi]